MDKAEIIHLSHDNFKFSGHTLDKVWTWTYFGQRLDLDKLLTKLIFYVLDKHWTKFRPWLILDKVWTFGMPMARSPLMAHTPPTRSHLWPSTCTAPTYWPYFGQWNIIINDRSHNRQCLDKHWTLTVLGHRWDFTSFTTIIWNLVDTL